MKAIALVFAALILTTTLIIRTDNASAGVASTEGGVTIFGLFGDAVRSDDHKSISVTDVIFYNNSGSQRFSGNISLWFQQGAYISSSVCGYQRNNVSILEEGASPRCVPLKTIDAENFKFMPFRSGQFLSFYGEKHALGLNATTANGTGQIDFEVTVGMRSVGSFISKTLGNVSVSTTSYKIGTQADVNRPLRNLTFQQAVNVSNSGGTTETVSIALIGVPVGWTASVWRGGTSVTSVLIPPGEHLDLILNVTAPSHLMKAYVQYQLQGTDKPNGESSITITKIFPYNITYLDYYVWAQDRDNVAVTGRFELAHGSVWNQTTQRKVYPVISFNIVAGEVSTIVVNWIPPPFEMPLWVIAVIAGLVALLIAIPLIRRRRARIGLENATEEAPTEESVATKQQPRTLNELRQRKDTLKKSLDRLASDEKDGTIPKDIVANMKQEFEAELAEVNQQMGILSSAATRKKAILKALRNLEKDHKEGKVDKEVYASMKARYEKEAVNILRQMDETKDEVSDSDKEE